MRRPLLRALAAGLSAALLAPGAPAAAAPERWTASSTTASAITGNVQFEPSRIRFANGAALDLEAVAQVPRFKADGAALPATIFRVVTPADPVLLNGNRLCGGPRKPEKVTFIAVYQPAALPGDKAPRSFAAFSGAQPAGGTGDPGACGTFNYDKP